MLLVGNFIYQTRSKNINIGNISLYQLFVYKSTQDKMEANLKILEDDQEAIKGMIRLHQGQLGDLQVRRDYFIQSSENV